jgi:hypothetical protein
MDLRKLPRTQGFSAEECDPSESHELKSQGSQASHPCQPFEITAKSVPRFLENGRPLV